MIFPHGGQALKNAGACAFGTFKLDGLYMGLPFVIKI
jgi:hypothetical protein